MYDSNCWYNFPAYLKEGGDTFAHKVMGDSQTLYHLQKRRQGGIVGKTMLNTATKIYDYGNLLNDDSLFLLILDVQGIWWIG